MELTYCHIIALWAGFLLDKLLGDPLWLPHPIVAFGKSISFFTRKLNNGNRRILKGAVTAIFLVTLTFLFFYFLMSFSYQISPVAGIAIETIFVFFGLAGTTLVKEGKAVFEALEGTLDAGRKQVIVGRDTQSLTGNGIQAAKLETLAENLSDGVIAPLFWFPLGGGP
jgi:adenosylcobinamide-phosphate synthase